VESWGFVLVIEVEIFRGLLVDLFVIHVFALEVVDTVVEHVSVVAGFKVALCDGGEEALADLSEDVGWEFFMVGQGGLYSTRRHGHGMRSLDAGRWDWEW
jgi:hypothetical protein